MNSHKNCPSNMLIRQKYEYASSLRCNTFQQSINQKMMSGFSDFAFHVRNRNNKRYSYEKQYLISLIFSFNFQGEPLQFCLAEPLYFFSQLPKKANSKFQVFISDCYPAFKTTISSSSFIIYGKLHNFREDFVPSLTFL